jgi:hypothetical protein
MLTITVVALILAANPERSTLADDALADVRGHGKTGNCGLTEL